MRYLSLAEVFELHRAAIEQTGGAKGYMTSGLLKQQWHSPV
jgi:hypothetical protein